MISLLAISGVFFSLGAYFAGALEIITSTQARHHGAVCVRGDDAQPRRRRNRTGTPVFRKEAAGVDWSGSFVGHYAGGHCVYADAQALTTRASTARRLARKRWALRCSGLMFWRSELASMLLLASWWWRSMSVVKGVRAKCKQRADDRAKENGGSAHDRLTHGLILAAILFVTGFNRSGYPPQSTLFMLIGLEIMINISALAFVVAGATRGPTDGQVMYILAIPKAFAAAEAVLDCAVCCNSIAAVARDTDIDSVSECVDEHACLNHYSAIDWRFVLLAFSARTLVGENLSRPLAWAPLVWRRW